MIAFCLDRLGLDPAFLIGGEIPQLGGNARAGEGWLVVEGDESDRSVGALRPEVAVLLNVDLDHHTTFGSRAEVEAFFEEWLARRAAGRARARSSSRSTLELAVPGEHNRRNAAAALAALELAGVARADAERVIVEFTRRRAPARARRARQAASRVLDSYAHHPAELAADIAAVRERSGRVLALFQPHLYSRTLHLAHEFASRARRRRRRVRDRDLSGARGAAPRRERAADRRGARARAAGDADRLGAGARGRRARSSRRWARPGDTVLTLGAGDVDRAAPLLLEALA